MARQTPTQRLLDHLLPGGLEVFVSECRTAGKSWRLIAREIYETTGVDITFESLRSWFPSDTANGGEGEAA